MKVTSIARRLGPPPGGCQRPSRLDASLAGTGSAPEARADDEQAVAGARMGQPDEEGAEDRITSAPTTPHRARCARSSLGSGRRRSLRNHEPATATARTRCRRQHRSLPPADRPVPPCRREEQLGQVVHLDRTVVVDALDERIRVVLVEIAEGESSGGFTLGDVRAVQRETLGESVVDDDVADVGFADEIDVIQAERMVEPEQLRVDQTRLGRHRIDTADGVQQRGVVSVGRNVGPCGEMAVGPVGDGQRW